MNFDIGAKEYLDYKEDHDQMMSICLKSKQCLDFRWHKTVRPLMSLYPPKEYASEHFMPILRWTRQNLPEYGRTKADMVLNYLDTLYKLELV